ncbi:hypothetical protein K435DRAFT_799757 [Dendrothele bispora CBS 962.96]|uniref:Mid2 domain-containing protein n=1 Tax=Dendrothele bispora (strain CBS 962.96) TaxID=1314807 RepID=A0A4S8LW26_DENBC|nr:hypothetical protein K435DRAFT_799757 [Dendrothele bispora CBS 962.96]
MNPNLLFITLMTVVWQTTALGIKPLSNVYVSIPVVVSWFRASGDPTSWFFRKQNMGAATQGPNDYTDGASEPLTVLNPDHSQGEVTISFTFGTGIFRLLGFGHENTNAAGDNFYHYIKLVSTFSTSWIHQSQANSVASTSKSPTRSPAFAQMTPTVTSVKTSGTSNKNNGPTRLMASTSTKGTSPVDSLSQSTSSTSKSTTSQGDGTVSSSTSSANPGSNQGFDEVGNHHLTVAAISASIFGAMIVILLAIVYWFRRRRVLKPPSFDREMMILNKGSDHGPRRSSNFLGFNLRTSKSRTTSALQVSDPELRRQSSTSSCLSTSSWTKSLELSEASLYSATMVGYQSRHRGGITPSYYDEFPRTPTISTSDYSLSSLEEPPFKLNTTQSHLPPDRTDRQMFIQEKIKELRQQMISASNRGLNSAREIEVLRETIKKWEDMQDSDWALESD